MSSRQLKSKLRPIDPEFWTVENELPDPFPFSTADWMRSSDILAVCSTPSSTPNPAHYQWQPPHLRKERSDDDPTVLRTPYPGNALGKVC